MPFFALWFPRQATIYSSRPTVSSQLNSAEGLWAGVSKHDFYEGLLVEAA